MLDIGVANKAEASNCCIRSVLANVTGKWRMLLLLSLEDGPMRFGAIKRCLGDITQRVLTENLRALERDGYITRRVEPGPPVAVFYQLTPIGQDFIGVLKPMVYWSHKQMNAVKSARSQYDTHLKS